MLRRVLQGFLIALVGFVPIASAQAADAPTIKTVSNRADLISGGDVLVGVSPPRKTTRLFLNGRDVSDRFRVRANGRLQGTVSRLRKGSNTLVAKANGRKSALELTNHRIGGPVFSGRQVQPWVCETEESGLGPAVDKRCNAPTKVEYLYQPEGGGGFQPYDPDDPPADVGSTTTDQGNTVPYIVRRETGTLNRAIYQTAVLHDPARRVAPWKRHPGYNGKLQYRFLGGAAPNYRQGTLGSGIADVMNDSMLRRGFAVASATLNTFGNNTNTVTSAETVMMVKERLAEQFGPIRYTLGEGCSGGALQQQVIAESYPRLLDAIAPACSFPDVVSAASHGAADCNLLMDYYENKSPALWLLPTHREAVSGHPLEATCEVVTNINIDRGLLDPTIGCATGATINPGPSLPEPEFVYDPDTNPTGARCTIFDLAASIFGARSKSSWGPVEKQIGRGFSNNTLDNVGVQYGYRAMRRGAITLEQFVDLNEKIGGKDIDFNGQPERMEADRPALRRAYRTGQVNSGRQLARVPIVDLRGSSNYEFHADGFSYMMRDRLRKANGTAANQIFWHSPAPPLAPDPTALAESQLLLDRWMTAIKKDHSDRSLAQKVLRQRPDDAVDACWTGGEKNADPSCFDQLPHGTDARYESGQDLTQDILKCRLKRLVRSDYPAGLTDLQFQRLEEVFDSGVCDYTKRGVGQRPSVPWLTFEAGPGGKPIGPAPRSVPR